MNSLLPEDFECHLDSAVALFWKTREVGSRTQGGTRGNVISGRNLNSFAGLVARVAGHCGLEEAAVHWRKSTTTLPGYFRPTKSWDVVIVHEHRLLAVLEFKSQVGSFGNNFNNRTEEAIGSATDLWHAAKFGAFERYNHKEWQGPQRSMDPRPPFLGYLMLLEDCGASSRPVSVRSPHFHPLPEFETPSYADRYRILCERLMEQNLYKAAALVLSERAGSSGVDRHRSLSTATSARNLFAQLAGHLMASLDK